MKLLHSLKFFVLRGGMLPLTAITLLVLCFGACPVLQARDTTLRLDSLRRSLAATPAPTEQRMNILNELAQAYQYTSSDSSLLFANEAAHIAEQINSTRGRAWSLYHRNYALYNQGKYDVAMEILMQALPLFEQLRDSNGLAHTLNDIGNIYKRREHYSEALGYYNHALTVFERIGNIEGAVLELCNMGATWRMQGDYEQSRAQSLKALQSAETISYKYGIVFASTNLGQYWMYWGQYDSAMAYFQRALALSQEIRSDKYTGQLHYLIGGVYAKKKDFPRAIEFATRGVEIAKKARFAERVKEGYQTFVEIYTAERDFQTALQYHHLYTNLKDSLFSVEVQDNISALQTKVATEQKEREIQLLRKEQEIQSLVRNSLVGGVALMLLLLGVAVNRYTIKQKAARELRETNAQLADANAEITRQMVIQTEQAREIELANTSLQDMNSTLERQNVELTELNNEKNEFLGIVAHDLKNPLSGIRGLADMIITLDGLSEAQKQEMLSTIVQSSERMFELINNLLDVNSLERGGKQFDATDIDLAFAAQCVTADYRTRAAQKNITLHYSTSVEKAMVIADEMATYQVIENIVSNAVKYSPHGKNVYVHVEPSTAKPDCMRVSVRDEGEGISAKDMGRLFGKFARLSAQPTGGEHSTGLGLSIVKKMVEAMNGRVWCESEAGGGLPTGATFIVELPSVPHSTMT
jgi:signal transduction histidine kinase